MEDSGAGKRGEVLVPQGAAGMLDETSRDGCCGAQTLWMFRVTEQHT